MDECQSDGGERDELVDRRMDGRIGSERRCLSFIPEVVRRWSSDSPMVNHHDVMLRMLYHSVMALDELEQLGVHVCMCAQSEMNSTSTVSS